MLSSGEFSVRFRWKLGAELSVVWFLGVRWEIDSSRRSFCRHTAEFHFHSSAAEEPSRKSRTSLETSCSELFLFLKENDEQFNFFFVVSEWHFVPFLCGTSKKQEGFLLSLTLQKLQTAFLFLLLSVNDEKILIMCLRFIFGKFLFKKSRAKSWRISI